jgi:sugar lactone lactonase YvrE
LPVTSEEARMTKPRKIVRHPFVVILTLCALTLVCVAGLNAVPAFGQGIITTVAGNGSRGFSGDGGPAVSALLDMKDFTGGLAADSAGNLYIADTGNHRVRKVGPSGIVSTIAGNGFAKFSGDGDAATSASLYAPTGLSADAAGNLYIVDTGNQRIRRVGPDRIITTVAGNGVRGFSGDGGIATAASLSLGNVQYLGIGGYPTSVAVDGAGNFYIADTDNGRVRKVDQGGIITSVVTGLRDPYGVAADALGNLFITDSSNDQILKVSPSGVVTTIARTLYSPSGVALDSAGNLYIADSHSHRIRKVEPNGVTSVIAGSGDPIFDPIDGYYFLGGFSGDGGPATSAQLNFPWGVAVDAAGNVYIADSVNNRIRKVTIATAGDDPTFTNPAGILFGPFGSDPYPSSITVSGLAGTVSKVTVTLRDLRLQSPDRADLAFLLVGPRGQSSILMSGVGMDGVGKSLTLTFDDAAPSSLTNNPASGTYKPSPLDPGPLPPPAPAGPYGTTLSVFNGTSPNGEWKLYAVNSNDGPSVCTILGEGCAELGGWSLTITTTPALPNRIDDAQFFVRQHYLDFLNREPDASGLAYWTDRITQCGSDARCIHERRIGVSAAFFIELEFQDTGYYVYRFYKASFGRQPNYTEFTSDRGLVVGGSNLEANKQAFADEWVQRGAFLQAYPNTMSNTEFANKLFDSAGLTASIYDPQRQQEIQAMNAGRGRALVLRDLIEIPDFKNIPDPSNPRYSDIRQTSQYNPAFVLMQYFGYLRRNVDQSGYDFWLDVVNSREPNNYSGMVCSFLTSSEYQLRFGSMVTRSNADCTR